MRMIVLAIVVGAFGTVPKGLEKTGGIGHLMKKRDYSDQSIILRRVLET